MAGVIIPVEGSILIPAGVALKVPPEVPLSVTFTGATELQKGDPVYDIVAAGCVDTVTIAVV